MSKLEELLETLCLDGVEFRKIESVSRTLSPKIKIKTNEYLREGIYPVIDQGQNFISGYTNEENVFPKGEYIIFGDHTCIVKFVDFAFAQGADGIKILQTKSDEILPKYLYYCMSNVRMESSYARHWAKMRSIEIPIPPLEVQREIVSILDRFADSNDGLISLLQRELILRQKQYEYYRNKLLIFDASVEYKSIETVCDVFTGGEIPGNFIKSKKPRDDYVYPIYSNGIGVNSLWGFSKSYRINQKSVTFSSIGTIGYPTLREQNFTPVIRLKVLIPKDKNFLSVEFLKYALEVIEFEQQKSTVPNINAKMIKSIKIPMPPIEEQKKIVEILDRFDKLCNDLTAGIPAEIQARQKQYAFYRDKLLSFKEKQ